MINELAKEIHAINVKNGFYEDEKNIGEMLCLVHSEVSEALEADRKGIYCSFDCDADWGILECAPDEISFKQHFKDNVKDTFEDEIADAMIRLMDLAAFRKIDLEGHIRAKMRYNSLRPYRHGKKY